MQQPEQPTRRQREPSPYTRWERRGSAVAHASALLVGVPLMLLQFLPLYFAFLPNPVVAYLIARSFRRRRLAWGAFQGMQATVIHLIVVLMAFIAALTADGFPLLAGILLPIGAFILLYTLWAAWDTLLGYDFRYIFIGKFLDRVSQVNLQRVERQRGFFGPSRTERDDKPRT